MDIKEDKWSDKLSHFYDKLGICGDKTDQFVTGFEKIRRKFGPKVTNFHWSCRFLGSNRRNQLQIYIKSTIILELNEFFLELIEIPSLKSSEYWNRSKILVIWFKCLTILSWIEPNSAQKKLYFCAKLLNFRRKWPDENKMDRNS